MRFWPRKPTSTGINAESQALITHAFDSSEEWHQAWLAMHDKRAQIEKRVFKDNKISRFWPFGNNIRHSKDMEALAFRDAMDVLHHTPEALTKTGLTIHPQVLPLCEEYKALFQSEGAARLRHLECCRTLEDHLGVSHNNIRGWWDHYGEPALHIEHKYIPRSHFTREKLAQYRLPGLAKLCEEPGNAEHISSVIQAAAAIKPGVVVGIESAGLEMIADSHTPLNPRQLRSLQRHIKAYCSLNERYDRAVKELPADIFKKRFGSIGPRHITPLLNKHTSAISELLNQDYWFDHGLLEGVPSIKLEKGDHAIKLPKTVTTEELEDLLRHHPIFKDVAPAAEHSTATKTIFSVAQDKAATVEHAAEGLWAKFSKMHKGKQAAIIGVPVAVGLGYWILKEKNKNNEQPQRTAGV